MRSIAQTHSLGASKQLEAFVAKIEARDLVVQNPPERKI